MLAEVLLVNRAWPGNPWNVRYRCLDLDYRNTQEVDQPAGACLAVKRKAWDEISGFDEGFFPVWFEDVDFFRRLRDKGWKIVYSPAALFSQSSVFAVFPHALAYLRRWQTNFPNVWSSAATQ